MTEKQWLPSSGIALFIGVDYFKKFKIPQLRQVKGCEKCQFMTIGIRVIKAGVRL